MCTYYVYLVLEGDYGNLLQLQPPIVLVGVSSLYSQLASLYYPLSPNHTSVLLTQKQLTLFFIWPPSLRRWPFFDVWIILDTFHPPLAGQPG